MARFFAVFALVLISSLAQAGSINVTTRINGAVGGQAQAQALTALELSYDLAGRAITDFELNHEKKNHVIVVSEDLQTFAHIHPDLLNTGTFAIRLDDQPRAYDADNQDAARAIPKGGNYFLFTEVQPKGSAASEYVVSGFSALPATLKTPLVADPVNADRSITKYFAANLAPSRPGDLYRVTLKISAVSGMVTYGFVMESKTAAGTYVPFPTLELWLGMPGHAILISDAPGEGSRVFRHMHFGHHDMPMPGPTPPPTDPAPTGAKVDFMVMGRDVPTVRGLYKIWPQVKVNGQILTFPFVFNY